MLHVLLTVICSWIVWQIVRYEIARRREAKWVREALRPGAGIALRGERLEAWKRAQAEQKQRLAAEQQALVDAQKERIRDVLQTTPWHRRTMIRKHLEQKAALGYDI